MSFEHWTALIVDDTPDNLLIAQVTLEFEGVQTYLATNGKECLATLTEINPTFILLDISMPVMDGWTALKHIRENPATAHIPVIAMTAHVMPYDKHLVSEAGFDGYIGKPIRPQKFIEHIQMCLEDKLEIH